MISCVYAIRETKGNGIYIGSTTRYKRRVSEHIKNISDKTHHNEGLRGVSIDSVEFIIIEKCPDELLAKREQFWIDEIIKSGLVLYNKIINVIETIFTDDTRIKLSRALIGRVFTEEHKTKIAKSNIGKTLSGETRKKISNSHIGKLPWNKNKKGLQVAWNKGVSIKGIKHTEKTKAKIRDNNPNNKPLFQIGKDGKVVNEYISQRDASRLTGFKRESIRDCCNGGQKTAYGYFWKYKKEWPC